MNTINRGDIYFANLNPVVGSEQGGMRPVVVLQNNTGNKHSSTVITAPITSQIKPQLPTHLLLSETSGLHEGSLVLLEQVRTIDKQRLGQYIGFLSRNTMSAINAALALSLGLKREQRDTMLLTLCSACARSYRDSDDHYIRRIDPDQQIKEPCTKCAIGVGFDYEVTRR